MNVLPALAHHLHQYQWIHTTHNHHPTIHTTTHQNETTTHIQIIQNDTTLIIEHTKHTTPTTYTKKHATISLLDPEFLTKITQAIIP